METRPGDPKHGDLRAAGRPFRATSARARTGACTGSSASTTGLRQRTLEMTFLESDAEAYSFTFG